MKHAKYHFMLGILISLINACITPPQPKRIVENTTSMPEEKLGTKEQDEAVGSTAESQQSAEDTRTPAAGSSAGEFFLKHSQPTTVFTSEDEIVLAEMPANPPRGSIDEAAIVVGIVKLAAKQAQSQPEYHESELYDGEGSNAAEETATEGISLEALCLEKQIDLPAALEENNLLKNFVIYQQVVRALRATNNSPEFITRVKDVIDRQATQWTGEGAQSLFDSTHELSDETELENTASRSSVADLRSGDSLLMEAQSLASGKRFKDAISKAGLVNNRSPLYETAQEKIVIFSTEAVQELRRKAAQAFQNAIPVTDTKARAAYLEQAKSHLEDALKNYPQAPADQLSTVRENLAVITRDLERLDVDSPESNSDEY